jgi:hypothetical protein
VTAGQTFWALLIVANLAAIGLNVALGAGAIATAIRSSAPPAPVPCSAPSRGPVGVLPEGA